MSPSNITKPQTFYLSIVLKAASKVPYPLQETAFYEKGRSSSSHSFIRRPPDTLPPHRQASYAHPAPTPRDRFNRFNLPASQDYRAEENMESDKQEIKKTRSRKVVDIEKRVLDGTF